MDTEAVNVRMARDMIEAVDAAAEAQPEPKPGRPEMVRRALAEWLRGRGFLKES
ncbi:hypothetical protein [Salinarimonas sp.]|uniref:hypothetical protein n=1 Tax=Salinarimonas sp. TaxID=2766526 RepID=UPI0032D8F38D